MTIADKITRLQTAKTAIATAITDKGGTVAAGDGYEDFAADIATIPSGGQGWQRPSAWGAYPSEFQAEKDKEDSERTMEAIYLLYHHDEEAYGTVASFAGFKCVITGGYKVERGHMVGSTFTVDSTTSVASNTFYTEAFTSSMPEYILYRITPTISGNTFTGFSFGHTDADLNAVQQSVIETYGRTHIGLIKQLKTYKTKHVAVIAYGTTSNLGGVFSSCYALEHVEFDGWDTSATTNLTNMFQNCHAIRSVDLSSFNTSSVTTLERMFLYCYGIGEIDFSGWDTSSVTNMSLMFYSCGSLQYADFSGWDMSAAKTTNQMFQGCYILNEIEFGEPANSLTNASSMFGGCSYLTKIDLSGWDISASTNISNMFSGCSTLINFNSCLFNSSVSFSVSSHLSHDSLISIINNLATVTTTQTLTIGATNLNKLTAAERAIATSKGWTLA